MYYLKKIDFQNIHFCKFRYFSANMKTYTNKNRIFTPKINHILTLNIEKLWQAEEN